MVTAMVFQDCVASAPCERRQFQRLHISVRTELRVQGNEMPIRVETADISMGGCYVEMAVTLDVRDGAEHRLVARSRETSNRRKSRNASSAVWEWY